MHHCTGYFCFVFKLALTSMVWDHVNITVQTNSQSDTTKVGAVNEASTNRPFTNWRTEICGKMVFG